MTRFDDETLNRRVDGELPAAQAQAIDAAAAADTGLAARLEALRAARSTAGAAFPARSDPRDEVLAAMIAAAPSASGQRAPARTFRWSLASTGRLLAPRRVLATLAVGAAAFAAGLLAAPLLVRSPALVSPTGEVSDPGLVRVLDQRLASDGPDAAGRSIGLTYRDAEGRWCRTFSASRDGVGGVACRDDGGWALRALGPLAVDGGELRTASSAIPDEVLAVVDLSAAGDPLDARAEAAARNEGWREP